MIAGTRPSIGIIVAVTAVICLGIDGQIFEEVSATSGIQFLHQNSPTSNKYLPETMGGGVAVFDFDNDGDLDIFFTNGARVDDPMAAGVLPQKRDRTFWNRLYANNGNWKFTDVTERSGLAGATTGYGMGVAVGDYDNDGFEDLYLTTYGRNYLYRNRGDGTFEDVTEKAGVAASGWSTSAGFLDFNNDGRLDLFVTRYLDWTFEKNIHCGDRTPGARAYCHPDNFKGVSSILYRNDGNGKFSDVSQAAGIAKHDGKGLGVAFGDYDGDGWTDIYVANDSVMCFLFRNRGDGTFEESALGAGVGYNEDGRPFAGMGVDIADFNNDSLPDIIVTNLSLEMYALYRNTPERQFHYATNDSGVGHATQPYSGWSTKFIDFDNDGWKDIFAAQGHVMDTIEMTAPNLKYLQPPLLLRNVKGRFVRVPASVSGPAFDSARPGRGAAFGDLDNDGDIDMVISNIGRAPTILKNARGNENYWLGLQLVGGRSNRDGIGCTVTVTRSQGQKQRYDVQTAAGYLSASDRRIVIGFEKDAVVPSIDVRWPSGRVQKLMDVKPNQYLNVKEPAD